ncbi:hypothetical protein ACJJI3_03270 [Microbulbifer sp. ZKSA004]|uniref:hypothetical protein n=1 Tax=Microbulbifer sp. ZKSA004 TaxID=3243389 RepID=UPI004039D6CD
MVIKDYSQQLNQLAELMHQSEAELSFKKKEEPPEQSPPTEYPSKVFWGKWGGHYIIVIRFISGRRISNIKQPERYPDKDSASLAALKIIRKYPQADIRYLSTRELSVYLL